MNARGETKEDRKKHTITANQNIKIKYLLNKIKIFYLFIYIQKPTKPNLCRLLWSLQRLYVLTSFLFVQPIIKQMYCLLYIQLIVGGYTNQYRAKKESEKWCVSVIVVLVKCMHDFYFTLVLWTCVEHFNEMIFTSCPKKMDEVLPWDFAAAMPCFREEKGSWRKTR